MPRSNEEILADLARGVLDMDEDLAVAAANEAVASGLDAYEAITKGLVVGMNEAGRLYDEEEYFVPELLICSDAMYAALDVLKPHLKASDRAEKIGCVIGVVQGDTHDIGKNLVKIMLDVSGFEVHDLGRDVPLADFIEKAKETNSQLICLSTLMTTTMDGMASVIQMLNEEGIRDRFKVMIGGGPISRSFAEKIGADGYADNAAGAVRVAIGLFATVAA
ncbi:MAG: corrinoid protein [Actinomycetota bacterium]|nr:corrinoid protein [Actinomycetota bacterium]